MQEAICNYNRTKVSPYDPTNLAIHSILRAEHDLILTCDHNFKKPVSFSDNVHLIDEENMVTYVGCAFGFTFYTEISTKISYINRELNHISKSHEKPKCIPPNDQENSPIDKQHTFNIFLNPNKLRDIVSTAPMSLNHTNDGDSMSN